MIITRLAPNPARSAAILEYDAAKSAHRAAPKNLITWNRYLAAKKALATFGITCS